MNLAQRIKSLFRAIFAKRKLDAEMDEEMRSHIELRTQANIESGMEPNDARYAALREFGWKESIKETCRDQRGVRWIENFLQDIRFGVRQLRKSPGFTIVSVLTLAFGIGANTAIFSFANAVLLRPLPFKDPDRLVMVFTSYPAINGHRNWISAPAFAEWRKQSSAFEELAARGYSGFILTGKGQPANVPGAQLSANIFRLLGVQPVLGRDFLPEEETYGKDHVVLLSHELWEQRFGGDDAVVGKSITLNDEVYTVIGVMPPRTFFPESNTQLWTPLAFSPEQLHDYGSHNYLVYGRLNPGVTLADANREMSLVAGRMAEADEHFKGQSSEVYSLHEMTVGDSRTILLVLLGSVFLVLLIGCVNIANLLIARSAARSREFAIRGALGATRIQVVRQLLTESLLLATLGGAGGILLAGFCLQALVRLSPPDLPRIWEGVHLDMSALSFAALVTTAAGAVFGLAPALQNPASTLVSELNDGSRGSSAGRRSRRIQALLVVSEVALSVILLISAGLLIRSFGHLTSQDLGYDTEHVITFDLGLPWRKYPSLATRSRFFQQLKAKVDALPGVQAAGLVRGLPLSDQNSGGDISVLGAPPLSAGEASDADYAQTSPGYFRAMKIPFIQGRDFNERDGTNSTPVAIVNEAFLKKFRLGTNVLGQMIGYGDSNDIEIIGVVKDTKRSGLANDQRAEVYRPFAQQCWGFMSLVVRTQVNPAAMTRAIRSELDTIDKDQPIENVRSMTQLVERSVTQRRLSVQILAGFASLAMLLAAMGLYGVLAYNVEQRTREIGVRMTLGAQRIEVLALVLGQGMKLALSGIAIGVAGALALTRVLRSLLFQVEPFDPLTFGLVVIFLSSIAAIACLLPAHRATRIDPMVALRYE